MPCSKRALTTRPCRILPTPIGVLACVLVLGLASVFALEAHAQDADARQTIHLDAPMMPEERPVDDRDWRLGSRLIRELARQSLLIAARDELGLRTRDEVLGEPHAQDGDRLHLELEAVRHRGTFVTLTRLSDNALLLDAHEIAGGWWLEDDYPSALVGAEVFSREAAAAAFMDAGYEGEPNLWLEHAPVPEDIEAQPETLSLVKQFEAARRLHRLIQEEGESPERLVALVRAYTQLGQLSRWYLRCEYSVFQARSLLYAQRLIQRSPQDPAGQFALAYAWTLAGYSGYALPCLDRMEELLGVDAQRPDWSSDAELLRAYATADYGPIHADAARPGKTSPLTALLLVMGVELTPFPGNYAQVSAELFEDHPGCVRFWHGMSRHHQIRTNHVVTEMVPARFGEVLAQDLPDSRDMPDAIRRRIRQLGAAPYDFPKIAGASATLVEMTARGFDDGELTWAAMGTLILEAHTFHVFARARFMRVSWGVDTHRFLDQAGPTIAAHPYADWVQIFRYASGAPLELSQTLVQKVEVRDMNPLSIDRLTRESHVALEFANMTGADLYPHLEGFASSSEQDWFMRTSWFSDPEILRNYANWSGTQSPHFPPRIANLVFYGGLSQERIDEVSIRYGQHACVAYALSIRAMEAEDWATAAEHAEVALQAVPESGLVLHLAKMQLLSGDEEEWLTTMLFGLELPDYGLDHSAINCAIASTLMNQDRYEEALPYAEAGATSHASWALDLYMHCLDGVGRHEDAGRIARTIDRRYGTALWPHLCEWSGQGNTDETLEFLLLIDQDTYREDTVQLFRTCLAHLASQERFEDAIAILNGALADDPQVISTASLIMGVCIAHTHGDEASRDRFLDRLIQYPLQDGERLRFSILGEILQDAIETGEIDMEAAEQWAQQYADEHRSNYMMYVGWFLAESDIDAAREMLLEPARNLKINSLAINWWRAILRRHGVEAAELRPAGFSRGHDWPDEESS